MCAFFDPNFAECLPEVRGKYRYDSLLSKVTWLGVGGSADVVYKPADAQDLADFMKNFPSDIPVKTLGVGSNLLVRDGGVRGVVIRLGGEGFNFAKTTGNPWEIEVGAGTLDKHVADYALSQKISGLSFFSGIPGTIGGALAMNAGAYGSDMSKIVKSVKAVDFQGNMHHLTCEEMKFVYRGNELQEDMIFTSAILQGSAGNAEEIEVEMQEINKKREASQPIHSKTGGCTFKNHPEHPTWKLIKDAGCQGFSIGGAEVSEKHANFIINRGNATAKDVEDVMNHVHRRVQEARGITLEWEIQRWGIND